jgi:hypothetical protein
LNAFSGVLTFLLQVHFLEHFWLYTGKQLLHWNLLLQKFQSMEYYISFRGTPCFCLLLRYLKGRMRLRRSLLDVGRFAHWWILDQNCDWHTNGNSHQFYKQNSLTKNPLCDTYIPTINSLHKYLKLKDSTFTYEKKHKATLHKKLISKYST